jgi:sigma-B regulation protein RsbU (phosphoserine phosphatase)
VLSVITPREACACPGRTESQWSGGELDAAIRLQRALLPPSPYARGAWAAAHLFSPAGAVGGDILDLIPAGDDLYFVFADVSGKGIAASMLTAYIHAVFRSLIPFGLAVEEVVRRASALLCSSTLPAQYATLVFGRLGINGEVVVANAGHPPPLVISAGEPIALVPTGTAAGLFCASEFGSSRLTLGTGDTLLLYSDGVTEAFDTDGVEFGSERLHAAAAGATDREPLALLTHLSREHAAFLAAATPGDDLTLLAMQFVG